MRLSLRVVPLFRYELALQAMPGEVQDIPATGFLEHVGQRLAGPSYCSTCSSTAGPHIWKSRSGRVLFLHALSDLPDNC